jgi:hypothetical protein
MNNDVRMKLGNNKSDVKAERILGIMGPTFQMPPRDSIYGPFDYPALTFYHMWSFIHASMKGHVLTNVAHDEQRRK